MVRQREIVRHYEQNEASALRLVEQYDTLVDELADTLDGLRAAADEARADLAAAYLVVVDAEALKRAEALTGFRGFSRRDPIKAMEREARVLRRTIAEVEVDERYRRRAVLVGVGGTLTAAVDEARDMLAPWEADCARFEDLDGFLELLELGYDTPSFSLAFWQPKYWSVWAKGDAICEALGMEDFGDDVLPAYKEVAGHRAIWRQQVAEAEAKVHAVHELARTRDAAELRIPQLPGLYLEHCQRQLAKYFAEADLSLLEQWLRDDADPDRGILMGLRRAAGADAKVSFVQELLEDGVRPALDGFRARKHKFMRKSAKYRRPKYSSWSFGEGEMDLGFRNKLPKYEAKPDKIRKLVGRIASYDDYGRFDLMHNEQEAWFAEMTRKAPPSLLPRTRRWYDKQWEPVTVKHDELVQELKHDAIAQAAAAAADADELGYLS